MLERPETDSPPVGPIVTGHALHTENFSGWRRAGTRDWLLILTLAGRGRFGHAGGDLTAREGDIVALRPGTPHDYGLERDGVPWKLVWVHFVPGPGRREWLRWPEAAPGIMSLHLDPPTRGLVEAELLAMDAHARGSQPRRQEWATNALERALLWCDSVNPSTARASRDPRVQRALDHIAANLAGPLSLEALAGVAGLSRSRFAELFRKHAGRSPAEYVEDQRAERARELLGITSRSVGQIAEEAGFADPFYFSSRFKKRFGVSPRAYRQGLLGAGEPT